MAVFVGLDCGGSSSRVLAIDAAGAVIFRGQSGPANLLSTPKSTLILNLKAATKGCPPATSVCGCFAGLVNDEVKERALGHLRQLFPRAKHFRAEPDYVAALAACGPTTDACVIAGTGSIVCSWNGGAVVKSGGRGPILGDPGSAAQIGRRILSEYLDNPKAASPCLKKSLLEAFGTDQEKEIIIRLYAAPSPAAMLARLGKAAAKESQAGLGTAAEIVRSEMSALAALVCRHIDQNLAGRDSLKIGLAGGLWKTSPLYKENFERSLATAQPDMKFNLFILRRPPVEGAATLAKEAADGN